MYINNAHEYRHIPTIFSGKLHQCMRSTNHNPKFDLIITKLLPTFAMLIEKDGGIRPYEVLATCAYKVLHSTRFEIGKDKQKSFSRLFLNASIMLTKTISIRR